MSLDPLRAERGAARRAPPAPPVPITSSEPPELPPARRLPDGTFGEALLVYRCAVCGAVGDLRAFPTRCLDCSGPRESIHYEIED